MNRADRRRYAKEVARGNIGLVTEPKSKLIPSEIEGINGKRYTDVKKYLADAEDYLAENLFKELSEVASKMLYETETYMSVANIMTMLIAMDEVVGGLKTVQKSYQQIINHINDAAEYIDKIGVREAYEEFAGKHNISMEFDDVDLNWVDDDGKHIYERYKLRVGK